MGSTFRSDIVRRSDETGAKGAILPCWTILLNRHKHVALSTGGLRTRTRVLYSGGDRALPLLLARISTSLVLGRNLENLMRNKLFLGQGRRASAQPVRLGRRWFPLIPVESIWAMWLLWRICVPRNSNLNGTNQRMALPAKGGCTSLPADERTSSGAGAVVEGAATYHVVCRLRHCWHLLRKISICAKRTRSETTTDGGRKRNDPNRKRATGEVRATSTAGCTTQHRTPRRTRL